MSWLPQSYGRDPGEIQAAYQVPVHTPPHVTPLRNQWLDAIRQIAPVIQDYIQRKKSDEIANQLLQLEHAPQELQGKGQLGLHGAQLFQQYQQDQEANTPDTEMHNLEYEIARRRAYPEQYPPKPSTGRPRVPVTLNGQEYNVTPNEAFKYEQQRLKGPKEQQVFGTTEAQRSEPYYLEYFTESDKKDPAGKSIYDRRTVEDARKNPDKSFVSIPGTKGQRMVPLRTYEAGISTHDKSTGGLDAFKAEQDRMKARVSTTNLPPEGVSGSASRSPDQAKSEQPIGMSKEQYDAMPSGTVYTAPDGSRRVKK